LGPATSLPNDIPQKPSKKSKKSLERGKESAISVPAEEAVTNNGSEKAFKSKHKPRKRAADFLSDSEDNAAHGASASAPPEGNAEPASKPKEKKSKKVAGTDQPSSNTKEILSPVNMPTEVGKSKERKSAPPPSDSAKKSSDVPRAKPPQQQGHPAASSRATNQGDHDTSTSLPAPSKKPKKNKKPKGQALVDAESLTADGVNGVVEDQGDAALNPITNKEPTSMSMQAEGQETVEKELEDEWASEDDEDDQGAALLAGFDSDGEDTAVDEGLERDKPLPQISKEVSKKVKKAGQKGGNDGPGVVYVG
jgi:nucleolar protein 15